MKALVIHHYGDNSVANLEDVPAPVPGSRDVLVKVRAASINPVDWKVRDGMLRIFTGSRFPKILGCECAGEVAEIGSGVSKFKKGDRVVGYTSARRLGAFAEYACVAEDTVYPIMGNIPFEQAACLPIAGLTALQSLRDHGKITAGKKVLVNGASGGVGHFAVQIAKVFGSQVTGVCSGKNAEFVKSLGADRVIDYTTEDFTLGDDRYDLIFDAVSLRSFGECGRVLAPAGIYVNTLPNTTLLFQILTSFLPGKKARSMWVKPNAADMAWMMAQMASGTIRVVIDKVFPFDRIKDALASSETGRARGKFVVQAV